MKTSCNYDLNGDYFNNRYINENGVPIKRTPETNPYNYDGYIIYRNGENKESNSCCYSDRMCEWDYKKFNDCCLDVWGNKGQCFDNRNPELIEKFLQKYFNDDKLKLIYIMQWCNQSSGYPLWSFHFKSNKE